MAIQSSDGKVYETDLDHQLGRPVETAEDKAPITPKEEPAPDYDYEGAKAAGLQPDERGHLPDTYKLPNHMTFSNESVYSNETTPGGQWEKLEGDRWKFTPSDYNLKQHPEEEMRKYFKDYEPDSELNILPKKMSDVQAVSPEGWDDWEQIVPHRGDKPPVLEELQKKYPSFNDFGYDTHGKQPLIWMRNKRTKPEDLVS